MGTGSVTQVVPRWLRLRDQLAHPAIICWRLALAAQLRRQRGQHRLGQRWKRMAFAGLQDRAVLDADYRDLRGEYDQLVSVEMIEAVGQRYLPPCATVTAPAHRGKSTGCLPRISAIDEPAPHLPGAGICPASRRRPRVVRTITWARITLALWPTGGSALPTPGGRAG